jgi:hypothetical protein
VLVAGYLLAWLGAPVALLARPGALVVDGVPYAVPAAFGWFLAGGLYAWRRWL